MLLAGGVMLLAVLPSHYLKSSLNATVAVHLNWLRESKQSELISLEVIVKGEINHFIVCFVQTLLIKPRVVGFHQKSAAFLAFFLLLLSLLN